MTTLRLLPETSIEFDAVKAEFERIKRSVRDNSFTTVSDLEAADRMLGNVYRAIPALRMAFRNEVAMAKERERLDRPAAKAPAVPLSEQRS